MGKFVNIFPLSIFRDRITLSNEYKEELLRLILEMEAETKHAKETADSAWLGDTGGFEFLFQKEPFAEMYSRIAEKVKQYTDALGINNNLVDFYFQRSWATVTRQGERIHEHSHEQSNISFAYYLLKPKGSGGINFITEDHPNEFSKGIFSPSKEALGFIKDPGLMTWNIVSIEPEEGDVVIFPSKTMHSTAPNHSVHPRVSISADVTTMLRDSRGHETMMPHFSQWRSFDTK